MSSLFVTILNMSLTGAFVIAVVCLARLALRKSPKIFLYCLWSVAGFRLLFPFSVESNFSLMPFYAQPISPDTVAVPMYGAGQPFVWTSIISVVWFAGLVVMLAYVVISLVTLRRRLRDAVCIGGNIYESAKIKTPFVMGLISPKIYLPRNLTVSERMYAVLHERTHINRRDHVVKLVGYLILCLHWFNPLAWLAFWLMSADMEMSCDERVLKELGGRADIKKDYSLALLSLADKRRFLGGGALAFISGNSIGSRIRNVLSLKRPSYAAVVVSVVLVTALSLGLGVDRVKVVIAAPYGGWDLGQFSPLLLLCCC